MHQSYTVSYYPDYVSTIQAPQSGVDIGDFIQLLLKSLVLPPEPEAYPPTVIKRRDPGFAVLLVFQDA